MSRPPAIVPYSDEALSRAKTELENFERSRRGTHRLARLRQVSSNHPVLLGMGVASLAAVGCLLVGIGLALAPVLNDEASRWFRSNPAIQFFPIGLILLSFCAATLYGVLYALALQFGADAPLLRNDLKELNRLRSEVQRLTVARDVQKRLTGTPAPARSRSYR